MAGILNLGAVKRSVVVLLGFQVLLWLVFGISYMLNRGSWVEVAAVEASTAAVGGWWSTFFFILLSNSFICVLLAGGNILVRFGSITPGLLVLLLQAVTIGWMAGSNGFEVPFLSVGAANLQFLKIGLWETSAYALICAVTLPKSLLVADTFPAKQWSETRRLIDIALSPAETGIVVLGCLMLIAAALIETNAILG